MKNAVTQIFSALKCSFKGFLKNPRIIITFLFTLILCFFLSERAMLVSERYSSSVQLAEPFIWTFGDAASILLTSLMLILLFMDLPKLSPFTPYLLVRTKKSRWMIAQFIYILTVTIIYMGYIFIVTSLLCMKKTFFGNVWSKTAALLAYSSMGKDLSVPSTVKVMENTTPYLCMMQMMILLILYSLTLSFLMLYAQMKKGKKAAAGAGLAYSLFGFILEPEVLAKLFHKEEYEMYQIRKLLGWISPLNHATYKMHNFGYDSLPAIGQSCILFLLLLLLLAALSFTALKKYNFSSFTGES